MHSILIITGPSCSGKTTVGGLLASRHPRGVHIVSDEFYSFVCHPVPPYRDGSHEQNSVVIRAAVTAAAAFARSSYLVVLEGVFGAWFLPLIAEVSHHSGLTLDCAVLGVELEQALGKR